MQMLHGVLAEFTSVVADADCALRVTGIRKVRVTV
jgi:hypothetical protein